ncbi:carboxypeptidase-like regulatory domain-containing protein [Marinospirillum perlucidum]|uniref:carboxypeptidase-like regulatory domain-containing protein n=1 Tax=Marinospirillum perlucidum TaxID=1982602 RepID=UPI000DF35946|nr:carboxypeptidase-like regulatory domain-containing protein [Marinospirillum perlucidum]
MRPLIFGLLILLTLAVSFQAVASNRLFADGYGNTPEEAREKALQELSQTILAAVESDTESVTRLEGDNYSNSLNNRIRIQSNSYFQGVSYSEPRQVEDGYRVQASLDREALLDTSRQLQRDLDQNLDILSRAQIQEIQDKASFLMAFSNYLPSDARPGPEQVASLAESKREEASKYLNFARISFLPEPIDASIEINNENLAADEQLLLPPGRYSYRIAAEGYHPEEARIYLAAGERRRLEVTLAPRREGSVALRLENSSDERLITRARRVFNRYSIQYAATSPQVISLDVSQEFVTEVAGMKIYNLRITAEASKGGQVLVVKRGSQRNVAESQVDSRLLAITEALVEALLKSVEIAGFWE